MIDALTNILCIEISLRTTDGDEMVLEMWTVKLVSGIEISSLPTVYYRMSVMLKSTLSISRITPAYKLARAQSKESYKIYHNIYGGEPNYTLLGESPTSISYFREEYIKNCGTSSEVISTICRIQFYLMFI